MHSLPKLPPMLHLSAAEEEEEDGEVAEAPVDEKTPPSSPEIAAPPRPALAGIAAPLSPMRAWLIHEE